MHTDAYTQIECDDNLEFVLKIKYESESSFSEYDSFLTEKE